MKVLIACEESQAVTIEMRKLGHEAFSCDVMDCSGGHPEWHIKGDCIPILNGRCSFETADGTQHEIKDRWDLIIGFPPCTYLSNAGACRLYPKKGQLDMDRYEKGLEAKAFFMQILNADCPKVAVENPVSSKIFEMPKHTQEIQPWMFGHPFTKKTRLWLRGGLPLLKPTEPVEAVGPYVCGNTEIWKKQAKAGTVYGKEKSAKHRSKTFPGVAKAMAEQWAGKEGENDG